MLVQIWRTQVDPAREAEYVDFNQEHLLPMFRRQPGCLGVMFLNAAPDWGALSLWQNDVALAALTTSPSYLETLRQLDETGLLIGRSSVEDFAVHGGFVGNLILDVGTRE